MEHTEFSAFDFEKFKAYCNKVFNVTNALPKNKEYELPPMGIEARKMFDKAIEEEAIRRGWITKEQLNKWKK